MTGRDQTPAAALANHIASGATILIGPTARDVTTSVRADFALLRPTAGPETAAVMAIKNVSMEGQR